MDVRLPNGKVLTNVPEGTTQEDIAERLQLAGFNIREFGVESGYGTIAAKALENTPELVAGSGANIARGLIETGDPKEFTRAMLSVARPDAEPVGKDYSVLDTKLDPQQEAAFQIWKSQYAPQDSGEDYDLRGAFLKGYTPSPDTGHFPDEFKKPNHPTFSNESKFAQLYPRLAGSWGGPDRDQYIPPAKQAPELHGVTDFPEIALFQLGQVARGIGRQFSDDAGADLTAFQKKQSEAIAANQPMIDQGSTFKKVVNTAAQSLPAMVPGIAASLATRNPEYALAPGMAISGGQAYGEQREAGRDPYSAGLAALGNAYAERIGEKLPVEELLRRPVGGFFSKVGRTVLADAFGEGVTQAMQDGIDKGTIKPDMTLGESLGNIGMAVGAGALTGATFAVPVAGVETLAGTPTPRTPPPITPITPPRSEEPPPPAEPPPDPRKAMLEGVGMLPPAAPVQAPQKLVSLGDRLDGFLEEAGNVSDPKLQEVLHRTGGVAWGQEQTGPDGHTRDLNLEDLKWAVANGRQDIAQAIVDRMEIGAAKANTTPGVSEGHPKYQEIKANLEKGAAVWRDKATRYRNLLTISSDQKIEPDPQAPIARVTEPVQQPDGPTPTAPAPAAQPAPAPTMEPQQAETAVLDRIKEPFDLKQREGQPLEQPYTPPPQARTREGTTLIDPSRLKVDAKEYQFRENADKEGVTERLKPVKNWEPILADPLIVHERVNGDQYVADGHQRAGLINRLREAGEQVPDTIQAHVLKESEGYTVSDARQIAAAKNIAAGNATPIEAAKVMREIEKSPPKMGMPDLSQNNAALNQARELKKLSDDAFGMVVNGLVPPAHAQYVGRDIADPAQQTAVMDVLAKQKPANESQARTMVQLAREAEFTADTQTGLFGEEDVAKSLLKERAYLIDRAAQMLKKDAALFKRLGAQSGTIETTGSNKLDAEANQARATEDSIAAEVLTKMANTKGSEVANAIRIESEAIAKGGDKAAAVQRIARIVRQVGARDFGQSNDATGRRPTPAGQTEKPQDVGDASVIPKEDPNQTVLPGAERISDRQLAERKMEEKKTAKKPQKAPDEGLFDTGAQRQTDLLDLVASKPKRAATEASVLPAQEPAEGDQHAARTDPHGRRLEQFSSTERPSYRRQIYEAMGLDPAEAVNMAPDKIVAKAKPLFKQTFDIEVDVSPDANANKVIDNLADAYVTFQFFSHILGIPNKALGLAGVKLTQDGQMPGNSLKLMFKKHTGGALGLYNSGTKTISIPGRSNSFSHEWGHALDYHVLDALNADDSMEKSFRGFSARTREKGLQDFEPKSVADAWINLMNSLFFDDALGAAKIMEIEKKIDRTKGEKAKAALQKQIDKIKAGNYRGRDYRSPYYKGAKSIKDGEKGYWIRPTEMLARAFEAYTAMKVEAAGGSTEMLAKENIGYLEKADERVQKMYPQATDRARIFLAIDQMMEAIRQAQILQTGNLNPNAVANIVSAEEKLWPVLAMQQEKKSVAQRMVETYGHDARAARKLAAKLDKEYRDSRPKNPTSNRSAGADIARSALSSSRTLIRSVFARNPKGTALDSVLKSMATNPGSMDFQPGTYWQDANMILRAKSEKLHRIQQAFSVDLRNNEEMKFMWNVIQGLEQDVVLPADRARKITDAAAEIRERIFSELAYELEKVGVKMGHLKDVGYLPQNFDLPVINDKRADAVKDFTEAYGLKFDREFDVDNVDAEAFLKVAEAVAASGSAVVSGKDPRIKDLRKAIEEATEDGEFAMTDEVQEAIDELYDDVREESSQLSAEALLEKLIVGDDFTPEISAGAGFTKARSFPPDSLKLLAKWRVNNPMEATRNHIVRAARHIAWTKHFGDINERKKKAVMEQGFAPEDADMVVDMVNQLTGRQVPTLPSTQRKILNRVGAHMTAMLLQRSVFASLPESHVAGLRTGRVRDSYRAMFDTFRAIVNTDDMKKMQDALEIAGVLESKMTDMIAAERMGGSFDLDPKTQLFMARFFENNLMGGLTRKQRLGNTITGARFIKDLARIIKSDNPSRLAEGISKKDASGFMKEFGIPDGLIDTFADYVLSLDGLLPPMEDIGGGKETKPMAMRFMSALERFGQQTIQNPGAIDRPKWAHTTYGRWVYALNSFNFAYWDNAIKSNGAYFKKLKSEKGFGPAAIDTARRFLPTYMNYTAWMGLAFMLRTIIFAGEKWDAMDDEEKFEYVLKGAIAYTLPLGPAVDLAYQSVQGIKYEKDITSVTAGAPIGAVLGDIQSLVRSFSKNSPNTNTAERARAKALYDLIVLPAVTELMGRIPGPLGKVVGVGGALATSEKAKSKVADITAGKKKKD